MRYNSYINNVKAKEWGLNLNLAYLFAWMYELPSWANKVIIGDKIFYFASKNKACDELSLLTDKPDTMYRYYKKLEKAGLIYLKKIDSKDYVCLTEKAKTWNLSDSSDKNPSNSDKNPDKVGNESESNSDKNPTDNTNQNNNKTSNNTSKDNSKKSSDFSKKDFKQVLLELNCDESHVNDWIKVREKKKAAQTQTALKKFIGECEKNNYPVASAVEKCAENSWSGFKYQWLINQQNQNQNGNTSNRNNTAATNNLQNIFSRIDEMYGDE